MSWIEKKLSPSIDLIKNLLNIEECQVKGISFLEGVNITVQKSDKHFDLVFDVRDYSSVEKAKYENLGDFQIIANEKAYLVLGGKSRVSRLKDYWDDRGFECMIQVDELCTEGIEQEESYYYRYMVPVDKQVHFTDFRGWGFKVAKDISTRSLLKINLPQGEVHFYTVQVGKQPFLIIESRFLCSQAEIDKIAYVTLLSFGIISGTVYLDEVYIMASATDEFQNPIGLYYKSLRDTIKCQYSIFTTNVYSVLMPIAKRLDMEQRMLKKIEDKKWNCAIEEMSEEVFSSLVLKLYEKDAIARAALLLLDSSTLTLELQPAAYCIAFETLCTALSKYYKLDAPKIVEKDIWDKSGLKDELQKVVSDNLQNGILNDTQAEFLKNKIANLNSPTNFDKLKQPFEYFGYPLSKAEIAGIKDRNRFMHGILNTDKEEEISEVADKLFFASLLLHKLSCVLLLKHCGFKGYIINNLVLHQRGSMQKTGRCAFIGI